MDYYKTLRIFFYHFIFMGIILTIGMTFSVGCSKKPKKPAPKGSDKSQSLPKILIQLEDKILKTTDEFEKSFLKEVAPTENIDTSSKKGTEPKDKKTPKDDKSKETQEKKQESQKNQGTQNIDWAKMEGDISTIHHLWNDFQGEATKSGASIDQIHGFSQKLGELTVTLTQKDLYRGLITANELYDKVISFEKNYGKPNDLKRILFYSKDASFKALKGNRELAISSLEEAKTLWEITKVHVKDTTTADKIDFSLKEFSDAINLQDPNLIKIKIKILEKNLTSVINAI